jgi:hypothetical protein
MPSCGVVPVKKQDIRGREAQLLIVVVDRTFGLQSSAVQQRKIHELQLGAHAAGLTGTVVPLWIDDGQVQFVADRRWHASLKELSPEILETRTHGTLSW